MSGRNRLAPLAVALLSSWALIACASISLAQSSSTHTTDPGVVPDEELTLVVGTRFVTPPADEMTPKALFAEARIPLTAFNETDRCVDQSALEAAQDYFSTAFDRSLGKAGFFYIVPEDDVRKLVAMCEKTHGRPPQAWVADKTKIIAFGRVVPTVDAPALEQSIR